MEDEDLTQNLTWSAFEFEEIEKNSDWFWALGVIIVAASATAIIYGNYSFAILMIISGILLGFFATKKPDLVSYELNDKGLKVRTRLFPYENIKSFWVQVNEPTQIGIFNKEEELRSIFFIKSERFFMPIISVPIDEEIAGEIQSIMLSKNIPEEKMKEHPSIKIMESIGF